MTGGLKSDPEHWRDRAEEARLLAEEMRDPKAKRQMFGIVAGYERLARQDEQRRREHEHST